MNNITHKKNIGIRDILLCVVFYLLLILPFIFFGKYIHIAALYFFNELAIITACFILIRLRKISLPDIGIKSIQLRVIFIWGISGGVISVLLATLSDPVLQRIFSKEALENSQQLPGIFTHPGSYFVKGLLVFTICILAPVSEELLFRGIFFTGIAETLAPVHGIWISALFFAGSHFNYIIFMPLLLIGIVFGYIYYKTGNLLPGILAHSINNLTAIIVLLT